MFDKILIANRGEIAVRIIATCRRLGIASAVVYSAADVASLAVELADEAVAIGPAPARESYLVADRIIAAARSIGAQAVHPGYGFLSEQAEFARRCAEEGLVFIGPNPAAIAAMGDKIQSKRFASTAGVSTVPGFQGEIEDLVQARREADALGYPVMIKASAGGGGKGIRVAYDAAQLGEGYEAVRAEALGAFGDDRILIETFIENPRHIEIQVLGDRHGNVVHLFERECSIQRRNQKVIEEAPSPLLDADTRAAMGAQAVALARAVNYDSAGTVEFVASQDKRFFFLEMNTRLQVEHPVTELVTGVDLVEQMIRVAAGEPLGFRQEDLALNGWALESRVYAEDPYRGFLPSIGRLVRYSPPVAGEVGEGVVRNDAGVREGDEISMFYDPMISKLCTWGSTRAAAVELMTEALDAFEIEGVAHNIPFLSALVGQDRFRSGRLSTRYIADAFPDGFAGLEVDADQRDIMSAAVLFAHLLETGRVQAQTSPREHWVVVDVLGERRVSARRVENGLDLILADEERRLALRDVAWTPGLVRFEATLDGRRFRLKLRPLALGFDVRHRAARSRVMVLTPRAAALYKALPEKIPADTSRRIVSPMPGLIVRLDVELEAEVKAGQTVLVIEAMKMQNIVRAERDGHVARIAVKVGDSVAADEVLVELA